MTELGLTYFLCFVCAFSLESRLPLDKLLERVLVVFTLVAGQLILAVQLLSLFSVLTGGGLLLACLVFGAVGYGITFIRPMPAGRRPWKTLLKENWVGVTGEQLPVLFLLASGAGLILLYTSLGACMFPFGDSYHYERPLFWIQNHSLAPFTVPNPRINVTSFADDALALPGFLDGRGGLMLAVLTVSPGILSLAAVFSLARKLGCGPRAAACASLILPGFSIFAVAFLTLNADFYLAGMWTGASLIFLMEDPGVSGPLPNRRTVRLGLSLGCFLMACGAKNGTVFLAPFYLAAMALSVRRSPFKKQVVFSLALFGVLGVICSGTAWNYIENLRWYGNTQGPPFTQGLVSRELNLRSIWTRMARDTTLLAFDFLYVPASHRDAYGALCQKTVRLLGGKDRLAEDDEFGGYDFDRDTISPRAGFGLVGILFILPALVVALRRVVGGGNAAKTATPVQRRNLAILLVCGLGCFLMSHTLLRWQSIGLWRLTPSLPVMAAALCGLLLEKFRSQLLLLPVLGFSALIFLTFDTGMMARRFEWMDHNWFLGKISASARQHGRKFEYRWADEPWRELLIREDYVCRQVSQKFMERVEHGATIGFVGDPNSLVYYLFGADFSDKVVPLNDAGALAHLAPPPDGAKYLVFEQAQNIPDDEIAWATNRGYAVVFQAFQETNCLFVGFRKSF